MKWKEFIKIAEAHGWRYWKSGARHDMYRPHNRKDVLVIPRHGSKEAPDGTLQKLKKQVGI